MFVVVYAVERSVKLSLLAPVAVTGGLRIHSPPSFDNPTRIGSGLHSWPEAVDIVLTPGIAARFEVGQAALLWMALVVVGRSWILSPHPFSLSCFDIRISLDE